MKQNKHRPLLLGGPKPATATGAAKKCWSIASVSADEGEIVLYGDVMSAQPVDWWTGEPQPGLYITPEGFMEDLAQVKDKGRITVKLNSVGGDLYTGIAIHNAIKALPGDVTVIVEGIAASAASVIMCAGDTVQVYPGSLVMIHEPACVMYDYVQIDDLKQVIKFLDAGIRSSAEIYAAKTGLEVDALKSMMNKETWMTGREAVDNGFADELIEGGGPEAKLVGKEILMVAGVQHSIKGLHIPESLHIPRVSSAPAAKATPKAAAGINKPEGTTPGNSDRGGNPMYNTIDELRQAEPTLVSQIEAAATSEAVKAERERLKAIEEIAVSVGDAALVQDAKYGEKPCTAEALALKAMQKQAQLGTKHLEATATDNAASGAQKVEAVGAQTDDKPMTPEQRKAQGRADAKAMKKEEK